MFAAPGKAEAATVTLAWDASAGATGYTLVYGTQSGVYDQQINVGSARQAPISGLAPGTTYYFAVRAFSAAGTSGFSNQVSTTTSSLGPDLASSDFNLDGSPDLLWQRTDGTLVTWRMSGINMLSSAYLSPSAVTDPEWRIAGTADFNGDSWPDLLWQHRTNGGLAAWMMRDSTMQSARLLNPAAVSDPLWKIVGVADFNADSHVDLLWEHQGNGGLVVWFMNGTSMVSASWLSPTASTDLNWKIAVVADLDTDGKPDLLWQNKVTGGLVVWFMGGTSSLTMTRATWVTPSSASTPKWKVIGAARINADSHLDLLWQHQDSGELAVWFMNGLTMTGASYLNPSGVADQTWRVVGAR